MNAALSGSTRSLDFCSPFYQGKGETININRAILRCKTHVVLTTGGACSAGNHWGCRILQMLGSSGAGGI